MFFYTIHYKLSTINYPLSTALTMELDIKKNWDLLENSRMALMQELSKYDNAILNKKPEPNAWSANQNIIHLMEAELGSLAYLRKKLSFGSNVPKSGFKSAFRLRMLKIIFALPLKFKAPPSLKQPAEVSNFNELKSTWASQRLDFQDFIDNLPNNVIYGEIWNHPIAGKMNIVQMIDFFNQHFNRHRLQIDKTLPKVA